MNPHDEREVARLAVVDVLLDELHGTFRPADQSARILARFRAGDGAGAVRRIAIAERRPGIHPWLLAALLLVGLAVVVGVAFAKRATDEAAANQDPPDSEIVPVPDVASLRRLLPQVVRITFEWRDLSGPALAPTPRLFVDGKSAQLSQIVRGLDRATAVQPAWWAWENRLWLHLGDGRRIEMAIQQDSPAPTLRLGMIGGDLGASNDLVVDAATRAIVLPLLAEARQRARVAQGLVASVDDLVGPAALPPSTTMLRFAGAPASALVHLQRFRDLRQLDLAGLTGAVDATALGAVGRCGALESLSLAGLALRDQDFVFLAELPSLHTLQLEGARGLTGTGFAHLARSTDHPSTIRLRDVRSLTDAGLVALASLQPTHVDLGRAQGDTGEAGWRALLANPRLRELDLERWRISETLLQGLVQATTLQVLSLADCALGDADLAALSAAKSPLQQIGLRDNPAITGAGLRQLAVLPTLRELDLRGLANLTDDDVAALRAVRPGLAVQR